MIITEQHVCDGTAVPSWINETPNWENIPAPTYNATGGLDRWVYVKMNGNAVHKTRSGIELESWLGRGALIIANPEAQPEAVEEVVSE